MPRTLGPDQFATSAASNLRVAINKLRAIQDPIARAASEALEQAQQAIELLENRLRHLGEPIIGTEVGVSKKITISGDRIIGSVRIHGSAPLVGIAEGVVLYVDPVDQTLKALGSAGTVTPLALP